MEDNFSTDGGGMVQAVINVSDGESWGTADEASLACHQPPAVRPGS